MTALPTCSEELLLQSKHKAVRKTGIRTQQIWAGIWLWTYSPCDLRFVASSLSLSLPVKQCMGVSFLTPPSQDGVRHMQIRTLSPSRVTQSHKDQSGSWAGLLSKDAQGGLQPARGEKVNFRKTVTKKRLNTKAIFTLFLVEI